MTITRRFPCDPGAVKSARDFVLLAVGPAPAEVRGMIAVMVGELTMNAIQHARTDFEVTVELTDGILRVAVTDGAQKYPAASPMPAPGSARGRGLPILDSLADDWGVVPSARVPGKSVWFTIAIPSSAREGGATGH